jgi:hypothetical protein
MYSVRGIHESPGHDRNPRSARLAVVRVRRTLTPAAIRRLRARLRVGPWLDRGHGRSPAQGGAAPGAVAAAVAAAADTTAAGRTPSAWSWTPRPSTFRPAVAVVAASADSIATDTSTVVAVVGKASASRRWYGKASQRLCSPRIATCTFRPFHRRSRCREVESFPKGAGPAGRPLNPPKEPLPTGGGPPCCEGPHGGNGKPDLMTDSTPKGGGGGISA